MEEGPPSPGEPAADPAPAPGERAAAGAIRIHVEASSAGPSLPGFWRWFGYDEANYTYFRDGARLLEDLTELGPEPIYVRTHNLLTTREGEVDRKWGFTDVYHESAEGRPVFDWTLTDRIFDTFVRLGVKPVVEIGFMPKALSTGPEPYHRDWVATGELWAGWGYPPTDYEKWQHLVESWVDHSIERYGVAEVETWLWEPWNEPNIGYWQGSFEEFLKLYDFSAAAVKSRCPRCRVGGPHTTNPDAAEAGAALRAFLEHCDGGRNAATGETGAPLDFVAFHAKGSPQKIDGHVRMNMAPQLRAVRVGFETVRSFPRFRATPVLLGEFDPEGCAACSVRKHPQYAYRNGALYPAYTVASQVRALELADSLDIELLGILTWGFEFENQPYFDGFRDLATNGIHKPIFNLFQMYSRMPTARRLAVSAPGGLGASDIIARGVAGETADVHALASAGESAIAVLVWHYHDDLLEGPARRVELSVSGVPFHHVVVEHYRIDEATSNAHTAWQRMGSPQAPSAAEYRTLERAAELSRLEPARRLTVESQLTLQLSLPRHAVSLLTIQADR